MNAKNAAFTLMARVLMALLFLVAGIRKLFGWSATVGYFGVLGIPIPEIAVPATILIEIGGAVALVAGWRIRTVAWVMAIFTFGSALFAHRFWQADPAIFGNQLNHFFKNVAIVGAFLLAQCAAPAKQREAS